jgi:hypothetical protein
MRVMVIVKATTKSEAGILPGDPKAPAGYETLFQEMGKFNEELVKAGVMLAGEGLQPSSKGKRVVFSGGQNTVVDGPFAETKELIAGYWLWQVRSLEEAIEWVRRCPPPMPRGGVGDRDPAGARGRGPRQGVHARAARAGGTPPRAGRAAA